MTITARFSSQCPVCGQRIGKGSRVEWERGSMARHVECCGQTGGERQASQSKRYGSTYTRFSSGAEVFTNKRGRCEDAPCCGCCS